MQLLLAAPRQLRTVQAVIDLLAASLQELLREPLCELLRDSCTTLRRLLRQFCASVTRVARLDDERALLYGRNKIYDQL